VKKLPLHVGLFMLTVASTFYVGIDYAGGSLRRAWLYAIPLMAILLTHELGHYFLARRHKVDASLPYFIPFPFGLGTFGAVISMKGRISTRNALLDIGAAGPIAGLVVAIPLLIIGLKYSPVLPIPEHGADEGQSLLYLFLKRIVLGPIPSTHDVFLHPTAFAGWTGLFLTMFNLIPVGQFDGGHIAYSLFGPKQDRFSRMVHRGMLFVFLAVGIYAMSRAYAAHIRGKDLFLTTFTGLNWLVWWGLIAAIGRATGSTSHPETEPSELTRGRRAIAWAMLITFVLLFMPIPFSSH
jgi:membrane-associated protease RseP (regulator of RpoE activity)